MVFLNLTPKKKKKTKCNESRNKQDFQKDILSIPFKLFQKIQEDDVLPNSFYEATITLKLKKKKKKKKYKYYKKIKLLAKVFFFFNILANQNPTIYKKCHTLRSS